MICYGEHSGLRYLNYLTRIGGHGAGYHEHRSAHLRVFFGFPEGWFIIVDFLFEVTVQWRMLVH